MRIKSLLLFVAAIAGAIPFVAASAVSTKQRRIVSSSQQPQVDAQADIDVAANWIRSLQYKNSMLASNGAIKLHQNASISPHGVTYYKVVPYFSNLAVCGLLEAPVPDKLQIARRWLGWHFAHLNRMPNRPEIIFWHWYFANGTHQSICPNPTSDTLCMYEDAADSSASTLLGLAWTYYQAGGSASFLRANQLKLERVARRLLNLQDAGDKLVWVNTGREVKYLMDNCEAYWGLKSMAQLETVVFRNPTAAGTYDTAAGEIQDAIVNQLFDSKSNVYSWARHRANDNKPPVNEPFKITHFYPDAVAQVWPQLLGVVTNDSPTARRSLEEIARPYPNWAEMRDEKNFVWPAMGYAALLAGDEKDARKQLDFIKRNEFPDQPGEVMPAPHMSVDSGGWLLRTLSRLNSRNQ